jgi:amino acid adenylation domain-containing protein
VSTHHSSSALKLREPGLPDPNADISGQPSRALIHDAFVAQAQRTPAALALQSAYGVCSFAELDGLSQALAGLLRARGVGQGATVAIFSDRNPALVFCLLGVLRAGAAFQIVDAAYPVPRIVASLRQTSPSLLLIAGDVLLPEELVEAAGLLGPDSLVRIPAAVDAARAVLGECEQGGAMHLISAPSDVAYLSFTSGSTGTPKGIVTTHAPLPHFVQWHVAHGAMTSADRFSMLSGLSHDPLLRDIFTPLSIGASLHIPAQATIFDADALFAWFSSERISVAHMTPALGEIMVAGASGEGQLADLRRVYWGGDVLNRRLVRAVEQVAPKVAQTNFYGATETPQAMGFYDLDELGAQGPIPIGRGIAGAQLLVLDEHERLCGPDEVGEIWIRSPYLSNGYLGDQTSSRARFVHNPFTRQADDLCYRTGDRGRYLRNGDVVFAGRADHQIKIRGFRVEPAEIVAALERVAGVRRAIVLTTERFKEKQLVAYIAHTRELAPTVVWLRQALAEQVPSYMVPRHFVLLTEFPLLPNGKVDLQSLPEPDDRASERAGPRRLPRTEPERRMAALWSELLGVDDVSIDQSFSDLGGDSLSAIRALSRMRRLGIDEAIARGIFQGRTIAELTADGSSTRPVAAEPAPLVGATKTALLINVLRGLLVVTLVVDHWRYGFFERFPQIPQAAIRAIEPFFHLPTPGFAFVFGIGLAYSQYDTFLRNPGASRRMLRSGAIVLGAGTLLTGLSTSLGMSSRGLAIDERLFFDNFYVPTLYYALALLTAPLWLALMAKREGKWGGSMVACLLLAVGSRVLYETCRLLFLEHEQVGFLQLVRLMVVARFSYFNLSTGALLGALFGLYLRRERERPNLIPLLCWTGAPTLAAGFVVHFAQRHVDPDSLLSADIPLSKWLAFIGATLLLGAVLEACLLVSRRAHTLRRALEWLGILGQCAMPVFILQSVVLDVSAFGRFFGLPDLAATALALGGFAIAVGWMMRRIHGLYYGALSGSAR